MVQHAGGIDDVEAALERAEFQNVGLRVVDPCSERGRSVALGIGQTGDAEVDRRDPGRGELLCDTSGLPAGAAAGDEDVGRLIVQRREGRGGELLAQKSIDAGRLDGAGGARPARVGVCFVLRAHAQRDRVLDFGQPRHRRPQVLLCARLAQLLGHDAVERRRPGALAQRLRRVERVQRGIHRERCEARRGDLGAGRERALDFCFQFRHARVFFRRAGEYIFVEEALARERAGEVDRRVCVVEQGATQRGEHALERDVAHRRGREDAQQERIGRDRAQRVGAEKLVQRETARPGRLGARQSGGERRQYRLQRGAKAGEIIGELRDERERLCEAGGGFRELALRLQHAAEIVAGFGMIGRLREHAAIGARGLIEPVLPLRLHGEREQLTHVARRGRGGGEAGSA